MNKADHLRLLFLGVILAIACLFAAATLSWRGRIALLLLAVATMFVWIAPEATGATIVHFRISASRWLKSMR